MEEEKTIEQQLEEANKKIKELTVVNKQYEQFLMDFDRYSEMLINYFNTIVGGIRSPMKETQIRAHYKEEDFSKSGEIPVYLYRNELIKHISSFFSMINNDTTGKYKKIKKLLEKYYKKYTY